MKRMILWTAAVLLAAGAAVAAEPERRGPVTDLPLPRFVSLDASEANMRRGPSRTHRIDWVLKRRGLPLEVTAEYGHWRRVRDRAGVSGWMHYALLSGARRVVVATAMQDLRRRPDPRATVTARAEQGAIARLGDCRPDWCRIAADGHGGWVPKSAIWGVRPDEIRD